jgi:hypothetical protein
VVFIFCAETAEALAAVNVKSPERDTILTGDAGKKISEWFAIVVVFNDKLAFGVQIIFRFNFCCSFRHFSDSDYIQLFYIFSVFCLYKFYKARYTGILNLLKNRQNSREGVFGLCLTFSSLDVKIILLEEENYAVR